MSPPVTDHKEKGLANNAPMSKVLKPLWLRGELRSMRSSLQSWTDAEVQKEIQPVECESKWKRRQRRQTEDGPSRCPVSPREVHTRLTL